ncbi:MAG: HdaA/DnaA family protein [Wenzhouxiangella sp.]
MTSAQIPLALTPPRRPGFDNFVAGGNAAVVETLASGLEPGQWYFLAGPSGSGRTHLLSACFAGLVRRGLDAKFMALGAAAHWPLLAQTDGEFVLLDDIDALAGDQAGEVLLFNALNRWREQRTGVIMSATGRAGFELPDLVSRLGQAVRLTLKPLEQNDLLSLVRSLGAEQEVVLGRGAADYLITRGPRSPAGLVRLFEQLVARALSERRTLSVPLIREVLQDLRRQ